MSLFPLPWERVLWSGRPHRLSAAARRRENYFVTDFRVVVQQGEVEREIALYDIDEAEVMTLGLDRYLRRRSVVVGSRRPHHTPLVLRCVKQAPQVAALLTLLSSNAPGAPIDDSLVAAAMAGGPSDPFPPVTPKGVVAPALAVLALAAVAIGLHGKELSVTYPQDDAIYPGGQKRSRDEIVSFMERTVMPWAKEVLGPLKGGPDRVTCRTCHGRDAEARQWRMPAVRALPEPGLRAGGFERYGTLLLDAQMRNAIYGYLAQDDNQERAIYMRKVVMPGMARLLHRPAYDFTQSYRYNRSGFAFGCYHCHLVSAN
jgi:hypothetical protein